MPYVALNVQNTAVRDEKLPRPLEEGDARMGLYLNGRNCGRWVEITFGPNCVGHGNDAFSEPPLVCGRDALAGDPLVNFEEDALTGMKVYAVVADSCQDNNYWYALGTWQVYAHLLPETCAVCLVLHIERTQDASVASCLASRDER